MSITVRPYATHDASAVERICRETAAERPFAPFVDDPRLAWLFYAKPYVELAPEWAYVAELEGQLVGYLVGTPDTLAYERSLTPYLASQWPALARLHVSGTLRGLHRRAAGQRALLRLHRQLLLRRTEEHDGIIDLAAYPAHCHLQVTAAARDKRVGLMLMLRFHQELKERGVRGQHCAVLELEAKPGYSRMVQALGFKTIRETSFTRADRPTLIDDRVWCERLLVRAF
jgi:hypothetical protein